MHLTRKDLLQGCLAAAALACPALARETTPGARYYRAALPRLIAEFTQVNEGARAYLAAAFDRGLADWAADRALDEFRTLAPALPYVGGDENENTPYLVKAAWYAAYYAPLRSRGKSAEDVGRMLYRLNEGAPAGLKRAAVDPFSPAYLARHRAWAARSRERRYPGDWVATVVTGDGRDFDWGCDYHECGIVKYLRSLRMGELAPFICVNDFLTSRAQGTGLRRTGTLAMGAPRCDFRYRKGRAVTQSWDTEIGAIREAITNRRVRPVMTGARDTGPDPADRLRRQIDFLLEIDRLKGILRRTYILGGERRENDAEHSWYFAMAALVLAEHADAPIDVTRVVRMALLHDIVEVDAGDTFIYDEAAKQGQHERELAAARRLFGMMPPDQGAECMALWEEFEARQTPESRFARALDRLVALILNYASDGKAWREHAVTYDQAMAVNRVIGEGSTALWRFVQELLGRARDEGMLR